MTNEKTTPKARPTSPHLQIYKPQITSMMSITHRATGVFNLIGLYLFAGWIAAITFCDDTYDMIVNAGHHPLGKIVLSLWVISLSYHLLNGLRHLMWDMGKGLTMPALKRSGLLVILGTILISAAVIYRLFFCTCGGM